MIRILNENNFEKVKQFIKKIENSENCYLQCPIKSCKGEIEIKYQDGLICYGKCIECNESYEIAIKPDFKKYLNGEYE